MRKLLKYVLFCVLLAGAWCCSNTGHDDTDYQGQTCEVAFSIARSAAEMNADSRAGVYVTNTLGSGGDDWAQSNNLLIANQPIYCLDDDSGNNAFVAGDYDPLSSYYEAYVNTYLNAYVYFPYHQTGSTLRLHDVDYPCIRTGENNAPEVLVDFGFEYHSEEGGYYALPVTDGVGGTRNHYYYGCMNGVKVERQTETQTETVLNLEMRHAMSRIVINIKRDESVDNNQYFRVEDCYIPAFYPLGYYNLKSQATIAAGEVGRVYLLKYSPTDYPYGKLVANASSCFVDTQVPCIAPDLLSRFEMTINYSISNVRGSGENGEILPSDNVNTNAIISREAEVSFSGPGIIQFKAGYIYTYNMVLSADRITVVESDIEPWKVETEDIFSGTTEEDN